MPGDAAASKGKTCPIFCKFCCRLETQKELTEKFKGLTAYQLPSVIYRRCAVCYGMGGKAELTVRRRKVSLSNLNKVLYPAGQFTKGQVIDYYLRVARFLLPHLRDRPVTLKRFPDGVFGEFFYEKDAPAFTPEWVETFPVPRRDPAQPPIRYILINDAASLVWCANLACLEFHPFLHRVPQIEQPTAIVFDLDPGEGADFLLCCEVACLLRELLQKLRLKCLAKVSGSKGLQVYVPLNVPVTYEATQPFAHAMAELLEGKYPRLVVAEMGKAARGGKVFIDWSQNADHKTTIGVYSLRAKRERPYVSMPVTWAELKATKTNSDVDRLYFLPDAALARLRKLGDLFAPVLKLKQRLPEQFLASSRSRKPKALAEYHAKRDFAQTTEPQPNIVPRRSAQGSKRRFGVQKHAASTLHYDLRLEMDGVLRSWAVPKGFPMKAGERRSAFPTEDHPLEYLQFEGVIPEGQYGGGTVMVWDIGAYEILEGNYWKGRLSVYISGQKLKGEWTLEKSDSAEGKPRWLLIKSGLDAKRVPARRENVSALTGKTLEQISAEKSAVWQSNHGGNGEVSSEATRTHKVKPARRPAKTVAAPEFVQPMKATLTDTLPEGDEWLYEIKWDGYRALAAKHGEVVRLYSLKQKILNNDFPAVVQAVRGINAHTALLDGEIVAVNNQGQPSFQMLQNRRSLGRDWSIVYYAFDLLNLEGADLKGLPLEERKQKLRTLIEGSDVRYSAELRGSPKAVVRAVKKAGLEGVLAKRRDSKYQAAARVRSWLKLKLDQSQEFVIGGYNPAMGSFQSILVGYYAGKKLMFAGKVRQGFNPASRASLLQQMQPLLSKQCPFANLPSSKKHHFGEGVTADEMEKLRWLRPKLVAQCRFTEWTNYGLLRHGTFLGLRDDKDPQEVTKTP